MPNPLAHFAIHADDVERARAFYEAVFGWTFEAWGPPEFYLVHPGDAEHPSPHGSLQKRQTPVEGAGMIGFECTIAVEDLDAITAAVTAHGGDVVFSGVEIPTVGTLAQLRDTEGNVVNAMQYAPGPPRS